MERVSEESTGLCYNDLFAQSYSHQCSATGRFSYNAIIAR